MKCRAVANLQDIVDNQSAKDTNLTGYFKANELYPEAKDLLYQDFPSKFVWILEERKWKPRQQKFALGRMCYNFEQLSDSSLYSCLVLSKLSIVYSHLLGSRFNRSSPRVPLVSGIV